MRLLRDRAGRKGKAMTLVVGLPDDPELLGELARGLKKLAGVGGTVRGDVIELQGDVRAIIQPRLQALGYTVKIAGG
ncbi:MAG TPA: translation initiation factor [Ktedonobacterales bacterium]